MHVSPKLQEASVAAKSETSRSFQAYNVSTITALFMRSPVRMDSAVEATLPSHTREHVCTHTPNPKSLSLHKLSCSHCQTSVSLTTNKEEVLFTVSDDRFNKLVCETMHSVQ